jgi:hypothetical protein
VVANLVKTTGTVAMKTTGTVAMKTTGTVVQTMATVTADGD